MTAKAKRIEPKPKYLQFMTIMGIIIIISAMALVVLSLTKHQYDSAAYDMNFLSTGMIILLLGEQSSQPRSNQSLKIRLIMAATIITLSLMSLVGLVIIRHNHESMDKTYYDSNGCMQSYNNEIHPDHCVTH
jgi:hypothetical protein